MREPVANPARLSRWPEGQAPQEVARLFRAAHDLPDEDLPKLMWRIRASQRRRALRPRLVLRVALVIGGVFCLGGFVGAYWGRRISARVTAPTAPAASAAAPTTIHPAAPSPEMPPPRPWRPAPPAASEAAPKTPKPNALVRPRARTRVAMASAPVLVAAPTPPSPVAAEQALIGRALQALRDEHQPQSALALLDEHARQFPSGLLRSEASLLRIEALLALGRKDEALSLLDRASLASAPNRDEQLVLRGELRSTNLRWPEAREDFDDVLGRYAGALAAPGKARGLQERALWGRAAARSRLGDQAGARADLTLYLRLFPRGRFAAPAGNLLNSAP